jgi:uncharacterized membrane protein (DUF373 family)
MGNNIDFKDLWKQQSVSPPNIEELFSKVKHFKRVSMRKLILINVQLVATGTYILFIWYHYQPEFISTKIGIVLMILAMALYLFVYNRLAKFYKTIDDTQSNSAYLRKLISIKSTQQFFQSNVLSFYYILLGLGLCLYMYECTSRMTLFWGIVTYVVSLGWGLYSWFYIRPKQIKKEQARVNDLITKFEAVNKQLSVNE